MKQIDLSEIDWYCDNCNAYLNIQTGFNANCGSWECEECGYENLIDESEIIWEEDEDDDVDDIPEGCRACGGPYPLCTDGCPLFDDD